jgi:hypothetical protein
MIIKYTKLLFAINYETFSWEEGQPRSQTQGRQMVYFQTKNPNLGKFWRVLQWKMLAYFMVIWSILLPICIFRAIWSILWSWFIFPCFGLLYQEKFGNPATGLC